MRIRYGIGLAAAVTLGGGCLQAMGYSEATLDPSCCAGGGGAGSGVTTSSGGGDGGGPNLCKPGETMNCYSGDMATMKIGVCKAGKQTCSSNGEEYGPCVGEVLPGKEDCSKPEDEDCDGFACSQTIWAKQFGDTAYQGAYTVAVDKKSGDVFVAGAFSGGVQFGNDNLIEVANGDAFVAKFDADGNSLWSKQFGDAQSQNVRHIAVESWRRQRKKTGHERQRRLDRVMRAGKHHGPQHGSGRRCDLAGLFFWL
jgi:hypothetical protein